MKIKNKKKFILSNLILFSILLLLFSVSKISLSKTIVQYTDIYIEEGDTLWQIAKLQQKNNDYYKYKEIREIIDNLKEVNHLKNSSLNVGQKISIPTI